MSKKLKIDIRPATREQSSDIASLIMEAMDYDCCQNFAGPDHTLDDFHSMMTALVEMDDSQYSFRNTLVAMSGNDIAGALVGYNGKDLRRLRRRFTEAAKEYLGQDYSDMDDETGPGEFYLDSLCVKKEYRHHGIATLLIKSCVKHDPIPQGWTPSLLERAGENPLPLGLLVDHTHPWAQRLYERLGFRVVGETSWGGHAMRHMQNPVRCRDFPDDLIYIPYHDNEWGTPVHNDRDHFMYLLMESMSCGLSWKMMLERREVFRRCFADFDAAKVAAFTDDDVERILNTEGMIRSPRKIRAMIANAQAFVKVQKEFGSFDKYIWGFTDGKSLVYPSHQHTWITRNDLSDRISKDLKKRGFKYVGSIIIYSHLQAIGIINDHRDYCFRYKELIKNCTVVRPLQASPNGEDV